MTMQKNGTYIGTIEALGFNGEGILHEDGITVFVPFALPTEKIEYKVLKVSGGIAFGKAIDVKSPSISRLKPKCAVFTKCGGCQLQHLKYAEQLKTKSETVKSCLSKIAFIDAEVPIAIPSENEYGYRNKLQLPVREQGGKIAIGFFAPNSHRIVEIDDCPIHPSWCRKIIAAIKRYAEECNVSAYNEENGNGHLKHIVVREVERRLIITLVITENTLKKSDVLIDILKEEFDNFSLFVNINKNANNVIFGERFICIFGKNAVRTNELGIKYEIGPQSFMQINDGLRGELYKKAFELSKADRDTVVIDAYSGAGLMTALFAERCKKAIGIEIVRAAVDHADKLKELNGIANMENICAKCEEALPEVMARERAAGSKTVLVLDPPRQGVDMGVITAIKRAAPERIVYISCSPQTLSRDLGLLTGTLEYDGKNLIKAKNGGKSTYRLTYIQPFDLFPQTKHVETVVLLTRGA